MPEARVYKIVRLGKYAREEFCQEELTYEWDREKEHGKGELGKVR